MGHANRGKAWEQYLELFHARYEAQGRAAVIRTPAPMRILRSVKGGQFLAVHASEGPPDYVLISGGIGIMAEAKECKGSRFPMKNLHAHQGRRLDQWERQGGVGVVLLRHQASNTAWILPWSNFGPVWSRWHMQSSTGRRAASGTASLSLLEIERIGVPFTNTGYLDALLHFVHSQKKSASKDPSSLAG